MDQDGRHQAESFLHSGEQLIAVCACEPGPGVPSPPESLLPPPEPSGIGQKIEEKLPRPLQHLLKSRVHGSRRSGPAAAADALDRAPDLVDDLGTRLMHGKSMEGGWQSEAGRFLIGRAGARGSVTSVLAVTDRRWFALTDVSPLWQSTPVMKQYWEVPRAAVVAVRANPTGLLQKGRMDVEFADLSWVALLAATSAGATAFAAAAARYR